MLLPFLIATALMSTPQPADAAFETDHPEAFHDLVAEDAELEKLADGFKFLEGPTFVDGEVGGVIFSDIPNQTLHRHADGRTSVFLKARGNGTTSGPDGTLLRAGHDSRKVHVTDPRTANDRVLVEAFELDGRPTRFNSPNDLVARADGMIFFTDPYWGLPGDRRDELMEYGGQWLFRHEPATGQTVPVAKDFERPNGLAFAPDGRTLYVGDDARRHVRRFSVDSDGDLTGGEVFVEVDPGVPDGMRVDDRGNLWCTAGNGVQVFAPDGTHLGTVLVPESPANVELANGRAYVTARTGLYAIDVKVRPATARD